jgi:phage tail protein X
MSGYLEHLTGPADRWDLLAYRYYGDANRTSPIVRANRHLFPLQTIPSVLPHGLTLRIPILDPDPVADQALPPWKREAA